MQRPAVPMAGLFIGGLLIGMYRGGCMLPVGLSLLAVLLFALYHHKIRAKFLCLLTLFFLLGLLRGRMAFAEQRTGILQEADGFFFTGTVRRVSSGTLYVRRDHAFYDIAVIGADERASEGDRITVTGRLMPLQPPQNPGSWNALVYYKARGTEYRLKADTVEKTGEIRSLYRLRSAFSQQIRSKLLTLLPEEQESILLAILTGDRSDMDEGATDLFRNSGIAHIIAISGLHIQILADSLYKVLSRITRKRRAIVINLAVLGMYCFLTGAAPSTVRAFLVLLLRYSAKMAGRKEDSLNSLAISAQIMLFFRPVLAFDSAFQLSFGAVLALHVAVRPLLRFYRIPKRIREPLASSVAVTFFTAPLVLYHFHQISLYAVLLNLLVVPLMSLILWVSVLSTVTAMILPLPVAYRAAAFLMGCVYYVLSFYRWLCQITQMLPFHLLRLGQMPFSAMVFFYAGQSLWVYKASYGKNRHIKKLVHLAPLCFLACAGLWVNAFFSAETIFLSVGQGDCAVLRHARKTWVVDAGPGYASILKPYLKSKGVTRVDGIFLSHMDADHSEGVIRLLSDPDFTVATLYLPDNTVHDFSALPMHEAEKTVFLSSGDVLRAGDLAVTCLSPQKDLPYASENAGSCVLHIQSKNGTILMMGDADQETEERILAISDNLSCDVLKVGHHGSNTSSSSGFLEATRAAVGFISCGKRNIYGHPHEAVLERIREANIVPIISHEAGALVMKRESVYLYQEVFTCRWMR